MNPRAVARAATAAGWGTGLALLLAGLPLPLALSVPLSAAGSAFAFRRWGGTARAWFRPVVKRFRFRRSPKTGGSLERA
jgi:hypothetical protein